MFANEIDLVYPWFALQNENNLWPSDYFATILGRQFEIEFNMFEDSTLTDWIQKLLKQEAIEYIKIVRAYNIVKYINFQHKCVLKKPE